MENRFYIKRLIIAGLNVPDASLQFLKGVNLILGSSDTGKSYIFQCLDYLLGSGNTPKNIPESHAYTDAYLEISTFDGNIFTIHRNLKSLSKVSVTQTVYEKYFTSTKRVLGIQNDTLDGENISEFLLKLTGIENIRVKINAANKTRLLSFRDIARLTLIDETRIITEESPVYTSANNFYELTGEKSAFRYLLTQDMDNDLVEREEKKILESRIKGKLEFIEKMLEYKNQKMIKLQEGIYDLSSEDITFRITRLLANLESSTANIAELTSERERQFLEMQKLKSSNLQNSELLKRFYLLLDHYKNDLERLNFILEGEFLFKQLISKDCPVCGNQMDEKHLTCLAQNLENSSISDSIKIEGEKIKIKLKDLSATIISTEYDKKISEAAINKFQQELDKINSSLNSELIPLQNNFRNEIGVLINHNKIEQEVAVLKSDVTNLHTDKDLLEHELRSKPKYEDANVNLEYSVLKSFAKHVEKYLRAWNFPGLTTVEFDSNHKVFDLKISQRGRNSHGKGIRALSYAAFIFGLLDYCLENFKPHPGVIVLDSPLTTYHNNQRVQLPDDEVSMDMQNSFFNNLLEVKDDRQIIILDNKIPSQDVLKKIHFIQFSNSSPRKGFFPSN